MPRAELPAIIPLRQFGENTWLAPGFIEPVGDARSSFALNGETVTVRDGRRARDGRLAGACLAMASAVRNCVRLLSVPLTTALRFASTHPAEFLGLGNRLGKLATGYRAAMVALDGAAIAVLDTWVAGAGGERFPEIDPLLSPIRPREGGNQQIYCFVALSVWVLALARE